MSGDWSTSREWSADHGRYPIDEGADYGFSTSANSTDFKHDDEYTDGAARGNQFRGSRYRMDDNEAGQRHNTRDMYGYDNENMESRFGGGRGGHGFQGKYGNHYGSLPLAGEDQRHWQNSGPSGQRGYFKGAQSRSNSDHGPMYANRSRSDNGPDGASNAGRYKRNIPIAPKDKDVNRTIFMRASSETVVHSDDIAEWFSRFGEVADVCNLIGRSGICYVMFYDSRCVQQVLKSAGSHIRISGVHLSLQPSRHRPDAIGRRPNPEDYQASVLLSLEGSKTMQGFTESDRAQFEDEDPMFQNNAETRVSMKATDHKGASSLQIPGIGPMGSQKESAVASGVATSDKFDVLSRLTLDPSLLKKTQAAKEILQQHKGLLGLDLPIGHQTQSHTLPADSNAENTASSTSTTGTMIDESVTNDYVKMGVQNKEPSFGAHMHAKLFSDPSDQRRSEPLVSSLLLSGLSAQDEDNVAAATAASVGETHPASDYLVKEHVNYADTSKLAYSPFEALPRPETEENKQPQQEGDLGMSVQSQQQDDAQDQSDGISRLLGILAQVQKSAYDEVKK
ncbi:hypothetical protein LPJ72_002963 [Coemansia sp. Benny D160-2]|nr:hypothetical protein LPJ72_002963 [Coemansia sp. Benny D160-2]